MPKKVQRRIGRPAGQVFLGIDPGKGGGLATITQGGSVISYDPMPPSILDLWKLVATMKGVFFCSLERVWAMPPQGRKQGATSMFTFGQNFGHVQMALTAAGISFHEPTPRDWQKHHGIASKKKTETPAQFKERIRIKAQKMFPRLHVWEETLGRQRAVCDALLIAQYCRQTQEIPF